MADEPLCPFCGATMEQKLTQVAGNRFVTAYACTAPCGESSYMHLLDMSRPPLWGEAGWRGDGLA